MPRTWSYRKVSSIPIAPADRRLPLPVIAYFAGFGLILCTIAGGIICMMSRTAKVSDNPSLSAPLKNHVTYQELKDP